MLFNRTRPHISLQIPIKGNMDENWIFLADGNRTCDEQLKRIVSFKYADFQYAYDLCNSDLVRCILDNAPIEGRHKRVLVDIKIHEIKRGEFTCVPGWHLDGSINPENLPKKPELNHLFVVSKHALTEFVDTPIKLDIDPEWNFAQVSKNVGSALDTLDLASFEIPNCRFATYDDSFFHRGKQATGDEVRLLVRVTETDVINPQNRVYTPYTHTVLHKDHVGLLEAKYHQ